MNDLFYPSIQQSADRESLPIWSAWNLKYSGVSSQALPSLFQSTVSVYWFSLLKSAAFIHLFLSSWSFHVDVILTMMFTALHLFLVLSSWCTPSHVSPGPHWVRHRPGAWWFIQPLGAREFFSSVRCCRPKVWMSFFLSVLWLLVYTSKIKLEQF